MNFDDFDVWWRERGDENRLPQMRAQLEQALSHKVSRDIEYSIRWRLARLHHFQAMRNENDNFVARRFFEEAENEARRAVSLNANDVAGQFWLGVCELEAARTRHKIGALWALPRAKRHLKSALQLDESFHFAGAWRVLSRIEALSPLDSKPRALKFYRRALEIAPHNSTTQLYFAELLLKLKQRDEAQKVLREIVSQDVDVEWKWEQARDKTIAARLLKLNEPRA